MNPRVLDVSDLQEEANDSRALIWWGNLGMIAIEGTMFVMLIATYIYLRVANIDWPPDTALPPDLTLPTINAALLILSFIPMRIADRGALSERTRPVQIGYAIGVLCGLAFLTMQVLSMAQLGFKWSDHAYGSIVWTSIGMHVFHSIAATGELTMLLAYTFIHPMELKQYCDIRVTTVYWYFVIVTWLPFYFLIYVLPHLGGKV